MEKFYLGDKLNKVLRIAERFHKLSGKTVYVSEDFDEPWGFFISTEPPMHCGSLYCKFGGGFSGV